MIGDFFCFFQSSDWISLLRVKNPATEKTGPYHKKRSWDYQTFSKWNSKFLITVFKGRPQEDEVFGLPGGNYPKEMGHQSRNLFQYGSGIKHSKKFSSLKDDIHSTSSSSKPTVVTDLGMYNWWFTFFLWCQQQMNIVGARFSYWYAGTQWSWKNLASTQIRFHTQHIWRMYVK